MSWITNEWRLKLLAVGLAVLMLGAVAFSQNPPTTRTVSVQLSYRGLAPDIVILNGPSRINVTFSGLADVISAVTADNITAFADATHATPGPSVRLNITAQGPAGVNVQPPAPIAVNIDTRSEVDLPVQVVWHAAPGWTVTKALAQCPSAPCIVHFIGPASWENGLRAVVYYNTTVSFSSAVSENWPVELVNSAGTVSLSRPITPLASLDIATVTVDIEAQQGSTSRTVPLVDAPPSNPPPSGYRVIGINVNPPTVTITGDPALLGRIQSIVLPAVDLSNYTSTTTITVQIPYPDGVTGKVTVATITYQIARNPNVSPTP